MIPYDRAALIQAAQTLARRWQRLVEAGYRPAEDAGDDVRCVSPFHGRSSDGPSPSASLGLREWQDEHETTKVGGLALLWPTYVSRMGAREHAARFEVLVTRMISLRRTLPDVPLTIVLGMQWTSGERAEALGRLHTLTRIASRVRGARVLGLAVRGSGKIRTINAAIAACRSMGVAGWIWVDDDVTLSADCLSLLARRFLEKNGRGAVGAHVRWTAAGGRLARGVSAMKAVVRPRARHPVSCCMVVEAGLLKGGIPPRFFCDDAYVYFRLLDPHRADPYEYLEVVDAARCEHAAPHGLRELYRRRRRLMLAHLVCMASAPLAAAAFYFRFSLFYGLWPLAPWDGRNGVRAAVAKWVVRFPDLMWFCIEAAVLAVRGALGVPRHGVSWGPRSGH